MAESVIIIGGSGYARVVIDCIRAAGGSVAGILDDGIAAGTRVQGVPVLGSIVDYEKYMDSSFVIAIGNNATRKRIAAKLPVRWTSVVHPSAVISPYATIGAGTVIMPLAVVNADATVGSHCIINTGAVVEHDNRLADFVHISPNAALGGTVTVGECTHIGIGACVRNNLDICENCVIGAGAAVVKNITLSGTYIGVPARRME